MVDCTLPQEGADLLELSGSESGGTSTRHSRLKTARTLQALLPIADGVDGNTKVLSNLPLSMLTALKPGGRGQSAFFQLGTGVLGWMPFGHAFSLSVRTYAAINKLRGDLE